MSFIFFLPLSFHFLGISLFRFVLVNFVLLSLVSFHFVDFVSFRFCWFRFVFVDFVSFLFRFALYRYPIKTPFLALSAGHPKNVCSNTSLAWTTLVASNYWTNISILSRRVPDECYFRNPSCELNLISNFYFLLFMSDDFFSSENKFFLIPSTF